MYSEWRACERFGMIPPGVVNDWNSNPPWIRLLILAYNDIRDREDGEMGVAMIGALGAKSGL